MRSAILALLAALFIPQLAVGGALQNNELIATVQQRDCVLKISAPEVIRRGDAVQLSVQITNNDETPHDVLLDRRGKGLISEAFSVHGRHGTKMLYMPNRDPNTGWLDMGGLSRLLPNQSIRGEIDIAPLVSELEPNADHIELTVAVGLDGGVELPWPNRLFTRLGLSVVLKIMDPEEYDAIVAAEERGRELQAASTQRGTEPAK